MTETDSTNTTFEPTPCSDRINWVVREAGSQEVKFVGPMHEAALVVGDQARAIRALRGTISDRSS